MEDDGKGPSSPGREKDLAPVHHEVRPDAGGGRMVQRSQVGSACRGYRMARHGRIGGRGAPGTVREHMSFTQRVQEKQCHSFPLTQGSTSHFHSRVTLKILKLALEALSNPLHTVDTQYTSVDLAT